MITTKRRGKLIPSDSKLYHEGRPIIVHDKDTVCNLLKIYYEDGEWSDRSRWVPIHEIEVRSWKSTR